MSGKPEKIIFLDIDGVLNHAGCTESIYEHDPLCVAQLNRITDVTGAKIVISSTWRLGKKSEWIKERLGITGLVIGITPYLCKKNEKGWEDHLERGKEIQAWLDQYNQDLKQECKVTEFVIIDDDRDMCELIDRLVQTDYMEGGLTKEIADRVIERLK